VASPGEGRRALPRVIAITDEALDDDTLVDVSARALGGSPVGGMAIQLRALGRSARMLLRLAERLQVVCAAAQAPLLINDRLDVALAVGAAGAHLGRGSVRVSDARSLLAPGALVTRSAHASTDVRAARDEAVDALLVSPIFASPGKGEGRGTAWLGQLALEAGDLRLFALGGIDAERAAACVQQGAYGVAVIRALYRARDPGGAAAALCQRVYGTCAD
jgi:thiamine-phosphate pyrophosphorylase